MMGGVGGEDEQDEDEVDGSPSSLPSSSESPSRHGLPVEAEEGFGQDGSRRGSEAIVGVDAVIPEISTSRRGRRRGSGRCLQLFPRPSREELVRLYLLRKRGMDKRLPEIECEVDPLLPAGEITPVAEEIELVSPSVELSGVQKKRRRVVDGDEQNKPPPKRLRNRVKAQKARDRKMVHLKNLEGKVKELEKKNVELEERCSTLQNENEMFRKEVMDGDSSGKEELIHYYESLEENKKEDSVENCDELNDAVLLDQENGDMKNCHVAESSRTLEDNGEPCVGMRFDSEVSAKEFYAEYAWHVGFVTRTDKCRRSEKDGAIIWRKFVCSKEGFTRMKEKPDDGKSRRSRPSTRTGCPAFIEVTRKKNGTWAITKFYKEHNHRMFCKESEEWMLSYMGLEENAVNDGSILGKEDRKMKSEVADSVVKWRAIDEPCLGMTFKSEESARVFYNEYGKQKGFATHIDKCRRSEKDGAIIWRRLTCSKKGLIRMKESGGDVKLKRSRLSTRTGCLALLEVTRKNDNNWTVTKFQREHNHALLTSGEVHHCQPHGQLIDDKKGHVGVGNTEGDFRSYLAEMQMTRSTDENDIQQVLAYFKHKQEENPAFFYDVQIGKEDGLINLVWVDARAQKAFSYFGDVLNFETSYRNNYNVPFALFTGVNHHRQRVLFGCALLMDVNGESLKWLFRAWLKAMHGHHPISVTTSLDPVMREAVAEELPNCHHRYNHWHILTLCKQKLLGFYEKKSVFKMELKACINHSETPEEFEAVWKKLVESYNLGENEWIQELYEIRIQWVPAYQRGLFFAELNTAQKWDNIIKLFDGSMNEQNCFHHFLMQSEKAVDSLYEEEENADIRSINDTACLRTHSPLESQAIQVYTNEIFEIFQEQFAGAFAFKVVMIDGGDDEVSTYSLERYITPVNPYTVHFKASEMIASCSCRKFEFSGILCSHVLAVFLLAQKPTLPDHYILRRWTKMANRETLLNEHSREAEQGCSEIPNFM